MRVCEKGEQQQRTTLSSLYSDFVRFIYNSEVELIGSLVKSSHKPLSQSQSKFLSNKNQFLFLCVLSCNH